MSAPSDSHCAGGGEGGENAQGNARGASAREAEDKSIEPCAVAQEYDAAPFDDACRRLSLLLKGMQRNSADTIRRLFVDHPKIFYSVVFYDGTAIGVGALEGVARLCLEPSERFDELFAAASAGEFDRLSVIDHEIRSLSGVATAG